MQANTLRYTPDNGRVFENMVLNELRNKGYDNVSFDNSKGECDFMAWKDGYAYAFQACYELTEYNRERELDGFSIQQLDAAGKTLVTFNQKCNLIINLLLNMEGILFFRGN